MDLCCLPHMVVIADCSYFSSNALAIKFIYCVILSINTIPLTVCGLSLTLILTQPAPEDYRIASAPPCVYIK